MPPIIFPLLSGVAASAVSWHWSVYPDFEASELLAFGVAIASIAGTMLGFMLAALAVIASISHTHLIKMMHATGHYRDLLLTLFIGCFLFLICAVTGFALMFGAPAPCELMIAVVGLHFAALTSIVDIGRKFWLVLRNLHPA